MSMWDVNIKMGQTKEKFKLNLEFTHESYRVKSISFWNVRFKFWVEEK